MANHKKIKAAIAVIYDLDNKILITQRGYDSSHPNKWELPGGKIYDHETAKEALYREVKEEVGLIVLSCKLFTHLQYSYPNKDVELIVYEINEYNGIAQCLEKQLALKWVYPEDLSKYDFLEANYQIIDLIQQQLIDN